MNARPDRDPILDMVARQLSANGVRAVTPDEWTVQLALDVTREQRRRHATDPRTHMLNHLAPCLVDDLATYIDVDPAEIVKVLAILSCHLGTLSIVHRVPGGMMADLLAYVADEFDRQPPLDGGDAP